MLAQRPSRRRETGGAAAGWRRRPLVPPSRRTRTPPSRAGRRRPTTGSARARHRAKPAARIASTVPMRNTDDADDHDELLLHRSGGVRGQVTARGSGPARRACRSRRRCAWRRRASDETERPRPLRRAWAANGPRQARWPAWRAPQVAANTTSSMLTACHSARWSETAPIVRDRRRPACRSALDVEVVDPQAGDLVGGQHDGADQEPAGQDGGVQFVHASTLARQVAPVVHRPSCDEPFGSGASAPRRTHVIPWSLSPDGSTSLASSPWEAWSAVTASMSRCVVRARAAPGRGVRRASRESASLPPCWPWSRSRACSSAVAHRWWPAVAYLVAEARTWRSACRTSAASRR